jgi:hypothetical protein
MQLQKYELLCRYKNNRAKILTKTMYTVANGQNPGLENKIKKEPVHAVSFS